jgi:chorismate mutase
LLFDLETDPKQEHPIRDPDVERRMVDHLIRLMKENDAPSEQFERLGLAI